MPSLEELESERDDSDPESESESLSLSELYESDDEYLLLFLESLEDVFLFFDFLSELPSEAEESPDIFFLPKMRNNCIPLGQQKYKMWNIQAEETFVRSNKNWRNE